MEDASERIRRWAKAGEDTALPDWNELPTIPLYMDQVIFTWGKPAFFERDGQSSLLTSSMINNYVKTGVLPHPEKKEIPKGTSGRTSGRVYAQTGFVHPGH